MTVRRRSGTSTYDDRGGLAAEARERAADRRAKHLEPTPASKSELRALRVLVVEDEEETRELMAVVLRSAGADVVCAGDVGEALELFERWSPNVLVSDLSLRAGDGCELASEIRRRAPNVAALAASGRTGARALERAAGRRS
jgi:CheY-like chemotaxis protein